MKWGIVQVGELQEYFLSLIAESQFMPPKMKPHHFKKKVAFPSL